VGLFRLLCTIFPCNTQSIPAEKWASAGEKSLAVGHIPGFQIDPKILKKDFNCPKGTEFI